MLKRTVAVPIALLSAVLVISCAPARTVRITEKFEPLYKPKYEWVSTEKASQNDYTIGIIQPEFIQKDNATWKWNPANPQEVAAMDEFRREVANTIESILLSKGCKVQGPFSTYEEMTYPERERCTFLIQPTVLIDLGVQLIPGSSRYLPEVGGPNLEAYGYATAGYSLTGNVEMEYVIYDPLTKEKLERHKLKSAPVTRTGDVLMQGYVNAQNEFYNWRTIPTWIRENPQYKELYSSYNNDLNVGNRILEELYNSFMPQVAQLLSVEEFDHLKQYQEQLKEKKRF